jgi:hypothetical protein
MGLTGQEERACVHDSMRMGWGRVSLQFQIFGYNILDCINGRKDSS